MLRGHTLEDAFYYVYEKRSALRGGATDSMMPIEVKEAELDGQQPVLAPAIFFGSVFLINNCSHIGSAKSKRGFCHARNYRTVVIMSLYL